MHFTDWVVAHSHLAMRGFASFAGAGGLVHAWQRMPEARYNARAVEWSYWLMVIGIVGMFVDLTAAGVMQGEMWKQATPWLDSVTASRVYWVGRAHIGSILTASFVALLAGLTTGPRGAGLAARATATPAAETPVAPRLAATEAM